MTNADNNRDTKYTIDNDMNNHNAHILHKWAQQSAVSCVSCLTDDVSHHFGSSSLSPSSRVIRMSHMCGSPWSSPTPLSTSTCPSPSSSTPLSWSTLTCTPTSTTWTPWKKTAPLRPGDPGRQRRHPLPHTGWVIFSGYRLKNVCQSWSTLRNSQQHLQWHPMKKKKM